MNIVFADFDNWEKLREIHYRRNIIIHNKGMTNELYCMKTGFREMDKKLSTNSMYIIESVDIVKNFIDFVHSNVKSKFSLMKPNK